MNVFLEFIKVFGGHFNFHHAFLEGYSAGVWSYFREAIL